MITFPMLKVPLENRCVLCFQVRVSRAFINLMSGVLWKLLITPTKKFLLPGNFNSFFFVNMNYRVDFAGVVLVLDLLNYCNEFFFFSCGILYPVKGACKTKASIPNPWRL